MRKVGNFARSLRLRLWSIFLGKSQEKLSEFDPSSEEFYRYWKEISKNNERAYYTMFLNPPSNQIQSNEQLRLVRQQKERQQKAVSDETADVSKFKENISGVLVEMPLKFLMDENFHPSTFGLTKEGIAPTDLWI